MPPTITTDPGPLALLQDMHAGNIAAHHAGIRARELHAGNGRLTCPTSYSSDEKYWWNEGYQGRPFTVLTDDQALDEHWRLRFANRTPG